MTMINRRSQKGFTLLEMMVVIVITIIMIGLVLGPVVQAFNLTSRAQKQIQAQDTARQLLERISRELSEAVFVYDNTSRPIIMQIYNKNGNPIEVEVFNAVIDFVPPKMLCHCNNPNHGNEPRDFPRGDDASPACPVCGSFNVDIRPLQPLQPDTKVVRYFIAKRFPTKEYSSPFATGFIEATGEDNPYVLYRAEYNPWDPNLRKDEPDFFYHRDSGPLWREISTIVSPAADIDLIESGVGPNGEPFARPLITFVPTVVQNDAMTPTFLSDVDAEVPNAIPTVFRSSYGLWTPNYTIRIYRNNFTEQFYTDYNSSGSMVLYDSDGNEVFNITHYNATRQFDPPNPRLIMNVDLKNGEVIFAVPGPQAVFDTDEINARFLQMFDSDRVGERKITLQNNIPNARIVPGSEEIIAPNATAGPNYGQPRRYERVPFAIADPGRNQYKISYETGEIWFSPRFDEPLPPGTRNVIVRYKIHNNLRGDVVRADYTTKNLITISLQIKLYDPASGKSQSIELSNKVKVNNTAR